MLGRCFLAVKAFAYSKIGSKNTAFYFEKIIRKKLKRTYTDTADNYLPAVSLLEFLFYFRLFIDLQENVREQVHLAVVRPQLEYGWHGTYNDYWRWKCAARH